MKASDLPFSEYHRLRMNYKDNYHLCIFRGYEPERAVVCRNDGKGACEIFYPYTDDAIIEAMKIIEDNL